MFRFLASVAGFLIGLFRAIRLAAMYRLFLRPRIIQMKRYVETLARAKKDLFPLGKSIFSFPGDGDTLYFVILQEGEALSVMEIFDEIFNRLPESYRILPLILFRDIFPIPVGDPSLKP